MTGILEILGIISWNRLSGKPSLCKLLVLWASKSFYFNHSAQHACTHKQISIQRTDRSVKAIFTGIARFMCLFDSLIWWMVVLHTSYVCCIIQQRSPTPNPIPNPLQMKYYTMLSFALSLPPDLFFFCHFLVRLQPCFDDILIRYAHISIYHRNKNAWNVLSLTCWLTLLFKQN